MDVITKEFAKAYSWLDKGVTSAMCLAVPAHSKLYKISNNSGILVDFLCQSGCFMSRPLSQIEGLGNSSMDFQIAQVQQELLKKFGLELGADFYNLHLNSLIVSYLLYSSLCYVQTEGDNGLDSYYVTKQMVIIDGLKPVIIAKDIARLNKGYFNDRYKTELSELTESKHKVITLRLDADGYHLGKKILCSNGKNTMIYPVYAIRGYKNALLGVLRRQVIRITCLDGTGGEVRFITSLNSRALCKWLGTSQENQCRPIWQKVESMYYEANLTLPNLSTPNEFVTINLFHIKNVEILS